MSSGFIFEDGSGDLNALHQGDILQKTALLKRVMREAHPYYADAEDYHFFMVLTQSCDLVRRGGKRPRARYITVAAVRPFSIVFERLISKHRKNVDGFPIDICDRAQELRVKQTLERFLHNTEADTFFIRRASKDIFQEDYSVFLNLSIALRIDHYEACLKSKKAQLRDVFQAKIGWLAGNIYSRVGTPDLESELSDPEAHKEEFFEELLYSRRVWLSPSQIKNLKTKVDRDQPYDEEAARTILESVPSDAEALAQRVADQLVQNKIVDKEKRETVVNILSSDRRFRRVADQPI